MRNVQTSIFGNDTSGLKGYIFTNEAETLVVVAIKGTSAAFLHVGGPTHDADKFNVNCWRSKPDELNLYRNRTIRCLAVVVPR